MASNKESNGNTVFYIGLGIVSAGALGGAWWANKQRQQTARVDYVPFLGALDTEPSVEGGEPIEPVPPSRVQAARFLMRARTAPSFEARILEGEYRAIANERGSDWLCPAYPTVPRDVAAMITLGKSPLEILKEGSYQIDDKFSKSEAHLWALDGAPHDVIVWWGKKFILPIFSERPKVRRDWQLVRWLKDVKNRGADTALFKQRKTFQDGQEASFRYWDLLSELTSEDLVNGEKTSVETAFTNMLGRIKGSWALDTRKLASFPKTWPPLPEGVRNLNTRSALWLEGEELNHCVGNPKYNYDRSVERKNSVILGVRVPDICKSTAQLSRKTGKIMQHYGPLDSSPKEPCKSIIKNYQEEVEKRFGARKRKPTPNQVLRSLAGLKLDSRHCISIVAGNTHPYARRSQVLVGIDWLNEQAQGEPGQVRDAATYVLNNKGKVAPGQCVPGYGFSSPEEMRARLLSPPYRFYPAQKYYILQFATGSGRYTPGMYEQAERVVEDLLAEGRLVEVGPGFGGWPKYAINPTRDEVRSVLLKNYLTYSNSTLFDITKRLLEAYADTEESRKLVVDVLDELVKEGLYERITHTGRVDRFYGAASEEHLKDALDQYCPSLIEGATIEQILSCIKDKFASTNDNNKSIIYRVIRKMIDDGTIIRVSGEGDNTFYAWAAGEPNNPARVGVTT